MSKLPPTAAEVIAHLQRQPPLAPVILLDPDTGWRLVPTFDEVDSDGEICITADYGDQL